MPEDKHEAFVIPSDVCYLGQSTDPRALGIATNGSWGVAANALSYGYLWNEIRVKGGAYGCGFRAAADRQLAFYTYRDPAIDPSIDRIAGAGAWLGELDTDRDTFEGYIVSTVSSNDERGIFLEAHPGIPRAVAIRDARHHARAPARAWLGRCAGCRKGPALRLRRTRDHRGEQRWVERGGPARVTEAGDGRSVSPAPRQRN